MNMIIKTVRRYVLIPRIRGMRNARVNELIPTNAFGFILSSFISYSPFSPNMPVGLSTRTIIKRKKAIVSFHAVNDIENPSKFIEDCMSTGTKFSAIPNDKPAIMAPGILPRPPMIMTANALIAGIEPV